MTEEEAKEKLMATGFCSEATVSKYLKAAKYIQSMGWEKFETEYDFAPRPYVPPKQERWAGFGSRRGIRKRAIRTS